MLIRFPHFLAYYKMCWKTFSYCFSSIFSFVAQLVKNLPAMQETWVWFLGLEDPLEKEMATHSSILAWRIPWSEKPGRLKSNGVTRVGHDLVTKPTYCDVYSHCSECQIAINISTPVSIHFLQIKIADTSCLLYSYPIYFLK